MIVSHTETPHLATKYGKDDPTMLVKYPRTPHLPWSPGATREDCVLFSTKHFVGREIVVTEKMDGENTTLYPSYFHARSLTSADHPSQHWLKNFHASLAHNIPHNYRICGEDMYAVHSIKYTELPSYFLAFSIWDSLTCLSWDDTRTLATELGIHLVPELYRGPWNNHLAVHWFGVNSLGGGEQEGYVVRLADSFSYDDFDKSVAKFVRANHVQSDEHWKVGQLVKNDLRRGVRL